MSSKTRNWNLKPGDPNFENGPDANTRRERRATHAGKKMRQSLFWKRLELGKEVR